MSGSLSFFWRSQKPMSATHLHHASIIKAKIAYNSFLISSSITQINGISGKISLQLQFSIGLYFLLYLHTILWALSLIILPNFFWQDSSTSRQYYFQSHFNLSTFISFIHSSCFSSFTLVTIDDVLAFCLNLLIQIVSLIPFIYLCWNNILMFY